MPRLDCVEFPRIPQSSAIHTFIKDRLEGAIEALESLPKNYLAYNLSDVISKPYKHCRNELSTAALDLIFPNENEDIPAHEKSLNKLIGKAIALEQLELHPYRLQYLQKKYQDARHALAEQPHSLDFETIARVYHPKETQLVQSGYELSEPIRGQIELRLHALDQGREYEKFTLGKKLKNQQLIEEAVAHGDPDAYYELGNKFLRSSEDNNLGIELISDAANAGHPEAQYRLGRLHSDDVRYPRDFVKAASWYFQAAEQGHAPAQDNLGIAYARGQGVPKSNVTAVQWFSEAADQGYGNATHNLQAITRQSGILARLKRFYHSCFISS